MVKISFGVPPPQKKNKLKCGGVQIFFVKNEKNQSCLKLPEMARKFVKNYFVSFQPLPPPKKNKEPKKNIGKKNKNVQNCLKWR